MNDAVILVLIICLAIVGTVTGFLAAVLVARGLDPPPFLALATGTAVGALAALLLRLEIKRRNGKDGDPPKGDKSC